MSVARRSVLAAAWVTPVITLAIASPAAAASAELPVDQRSMGLSTTRAYIGAPISVAVTIIGANGLGARTLQFQVQIRQNPDIEEWTSVSNWAFVQNPGPFGGSQPFTTDGFGHATLTFTASAPPYPGVNGRVVATVDGVTLIKYFDPAPPSSGF